MDGKIIARIVAGLVLLAALAGVAVFAFNAGAATHIQAPAVPNGQTPYPYPYYGFWRPFPFFGFGFGCFGPLLAVLLIFLAFRAFSFMLWGPRWGRWGMHRGWRHGWGEEGGVPPMFKQWHDRAHGQTPPPDEGRQE
ncbi:MAG: hypothetical protein ACM3MF_05695 [Anaerolineae bacterium]